MPRVTWKEKGAIMRFNMPHPAVPIHFLDNYAGTAQRTLASIELDVL